MDNMHVISAAAVLLFCLAECSGDNLYVSYDEELDKFDVHAETIGNWVAWATFTSDFNQTGWTYLEVYTSGAYKDSLQAYASGLAEGYLTRDFISMHWQNTMADYCNESSAFCSRLRQFLTLNFQNMYEAIQAKSETDPFWHQVELFLTQLNGMTDGYGGTPGTATPKIKNVFDMIVLMQLGGDLEDLEGALHKPDRVKVLGSGSCSALVKVLQGFKDIYISQDTWSPFSSTLRILKKYDFKYHSTSGQGADPVPGQVMTFSSYPGTLTSGDDFYLISTGLVSMETTIGNSNPDRWKYVTPQTVLEGLRSMAANRLATTGKQWTDIFSVHNSGTYNNQWMILDYKLFSSGQKLQPGGFYVLEQIPGMIVAEDMTAYLNEKTYWGSYNTPYFPTIFNASGTADLERKFGDWFSWVRTPRANIFRRDHVKVHDMESMLKIMRYNNFKNDPLSHCNCTPPYSGENGISARSDLNPADGTYPFGALGHRAHGGIDSKITNSQMFKKLEFLSVAGPTYDDLPPFQWSKSDFGTTMPHIGLPDLMAFKPITHHWGQRSQIPDIHKNINVVN